MLNEIYNFLSPYLKAAFGIWFTAWVGHKFFLKKYVKEKKADRNHQIYQQKDMLNKEVFDQIQVKIEEVYENLGQIQAYHTLLLDSYSNSVLFKENSNSFNNCCLLLIASLFSLSLLLEQYDFIIDIDHSLSQKCMNLQVRLEEVNFCITRILLDVKQNKDLNELCEGLLGISSEINLHMKKISGESKIILKNIFNSLDKRIEENTA